MACALDHPRQEDERGTSQMNTLTKRIEALEGASGDLSPEVNMALRELLGITGPVEPGWISKVPTQDLLKAREQLLSEDRKP